MYRGATIVMTPSEILDLAVRSLDQPLPPLTQVGISDPARRSYGQLDALPQTLFHRWEKP